MLPGGKSLPLGRDAVVVGTDRPQPAVLFIPSKSGDPTPIRPLIDEIQRFDPKHSMIMPDLVRALPMDAEFLISDKRSIKRAKTVAMFQAQMKDMYQSYEGTTADSAGETLPARR